MNSESPRQSNYFHLLWKPSYRDELKEQLLLEAAISLGSEERASRLKPYYDHLSMRYIIPTFAATKIEDKIGYNALSTPSNYERTKEMYDRFHVNQLQISSEEVIDNLLYPIDKISACVDMSSELFSKFISSSIRRPLLVRSNDYVFSAYSIPSDTLRVIVPSVYELNEQSSATFEAALGECAVELYRERSLAVS